MAYREHMPDTTAWIDAVRSSHERFAQILSPLSATEVEGPSYASDWSIAQTASHLGSQAEIFGLFLDAGLAGTPAPGGEVFGPIWDRWNALSPADQVAHSIAANAALVQRLVQAHEDRSDFSLQMFGREVDLGGFAAIRLSEHALHTWDIAVALDPTATVSQDAVELLVDQLPPTAARSGKVSDGVEPVSITTTAPDRAFLLTVSPAVTLMPADGSAGALTLPAEALVRLVYGRLDPDHTPAEVTDERLATLRTVFPGF